MSFGAPIWLVLLIPIAGFSWAMVSNWWHLSHGLPGRWRDVVSPEMHTKMAGQAVGVSFKVLSICMTICGLIVLALAQPRIGEYSLPKYSNLIGRVVVLDMSGEVNANEVRFFTENLIEASRDVQTGLVAVARDGFVIAPLTTDQPFLMRYLRALDPMLMPEPGRRLSLGIAHAQQVLDRANVVVGQIIVVSGGVPPTEGQDTVIRENWHLVIVEDKELDWSKAASRLGATIASPADVAALNEELKDKAYQALASRDSLERLHVFLIPMILAALAWLPLFRRTRE